MWEPRWHFFPLNTEVYSVNLPGTRVDAWTFESLLTLEGGAAMRKSRLWVLLFMMVAVVVVLTSCCGSRCCGPGYSNYYACSICGPGYSNHYVYPSDYSVWDRPNFSQPVAWNFGYWSSYYPRPGYFPVDYVPVTYGGPRNMVAVLHDGAP